MNENLFEKLNAVENHIVTLYSLLKLLKSAVQDSDVDIGAIMSLSDILVEEARKTFEVYEILALKVHNM